MDERAGRAVRPQRSSTTTSPPASSGRFADLAGARRARRRSARRRRRRARASASASSPRTARCSATRSSGCSTSARSRCRSASPGAPARTRGARSCATGSSRFGLVALATDPGARQRRSAGACRRLPADRRRRRRAATRCRPVRRARSRSSSRRRARPAHPKGIVISQAAVLANLAGIREHWDLTETRQRPLVAAALPRHGTDRHGDQRALTPAGRCTTGRPRASCAAPAAGSSCSASST